MNLMGSSEIDRTKRARTRPTVFDRVWEDGVPDIVVASYPSSALSVLVPVA